MTDSLDTGDMMLGELVITVPPTCHLILLLSWRLDVDDRYFVAQLADLLRLHRSLLVFEPTSRLFSTVLDPFDGG